MVEVHTMDSILPCGMTIDNIFGTSIRKGDHFDLQGTTLAYVAGGGVVVCKVGSSKQILQQRFFVANSSLSNRGNSKDQANAYLNMIYDNKDMEIPVSRDSFGYNIYQEPIEIKGYTLLGNEEPEQTKQSPSKLKDKARSINCIAISPNEKLLVVGETGYQPRVLVYSLAPDLLDQPMALIFDHSFGVSKLRFSDESSYLCSLGVINDGIINVWKISFSSITLVATNRLSSPTNQILWCNDYILTIGLRAIKIWSLASEDINTTSKVLHKPFALKGKNVILGQYLNQNFLASDKVLENVVLILTGSKCLLFLNLDEGKIIGSKSLEFEAHSLLVDNKGHTIWLSTDNGIKSLKIEPGVLKDFNTAIGETELESEVIIKHTNDYNLECKILRLNEEIMLRLSKDGSIDRINTSLKKFETIIPSFNREVAGVDVFQDKCLIFNKYGAVNQINLATGKISNLIKFKLPSIDLFQSSIAAIDFNTDELVIGDKFGFLYFVELDKEGGYNLKFHIKAHESIVSDMIGFEWDKKQYLVTISRDRMIQVFAKNTEWELLQTLNTHTGSLLKVEYKEGKIFVSSSDRTISIHELGDVVKQEKIISLKNTPVNMQFYEEELLVSTSDKQISVFSLKTYDLVRTFKLFDSKNNESLLIENFLVHNDIIFASSSDRSLRSFEYISGKPLTLNYGYLDAIVKLLIHDNLLTTITMDGCIFKWKLKFQKQASFIESYSASPKHEDGPILTHTRATRKIIPSPSSPSRKTELHKREDLSLSPHSNIYGHFNLSPSPSPRPSRKSSISSLNSPPTLIASGNSPNVRLSAATLKRMEAKKASAETNTLRSRSVSPSRKEKISTPGNKILATKTSLPELRAGSLGKPLLIHSDQDPISAIKSSIGQIRSIIGQNDLAKDKKRAIKQDLLSLIQNLDLEEDSNNSISEKETLEKYSEKLIELISSKLDAK